MASKSTGSGLAAMLVAVLLLAGAWPEAEAEDRTLLSGESGPEVVEAVVRLIQQSCILPDDHFLLRRIAFALTGDGTYPKAYSDPSNHGGIWQVDNSMLQTTQRGGSVLSPLYHTIQERFGIVWPQVTWPDLRKPLYSGLAAALYLLAENNMDASKIAVNPEAQASFLRDHYDRNLTPYNFTQDIGHILTGCQRGGAVDVALVVDGTVTDEDFQRVKSALQDLATQLPISTSGVRVALIQYSTGFDLAFRLDAYNSATSVANAINGVHHSTGGSVAVGMPAASSMAVRFAVDQVFPVTKGGRPFAAKLLLLVTDSQPLHPDQLRDASTYALQHGIGVQGLTVGNSASGARTLFTSPACAHNLHIDSYHDIRYLTQQLLYTICNAPRYASGTVSCPVESCPPFAFTSGPNGTTVVANVTCGTVSMYGAYANALPGRVYSLGAKTVTAGETTEMFLPAPLTGNEFLYVRLPNDGQDARPGCVATLTPYTGDRTDHTISVICEKEGLSWPCNATDLPKSLVDQICNGTVFKRPPNPCTPENMARGLLKFPDPYDTRKFIECDLTGKPYVTQCPENQVYSAECQYCRGERSPTLTDCTTPLVDPSVTNPCTVTNILAGRFFFAFPNDDSRYIQCDVWGHPYIRYCQTGFVWRQEGLTCEHPAQYNPCVNAQFGQRYFAHPTCNYKYIECNAERISYVMICPTNEVWDDNIKTCVPGVGMSSTCDGHVIDRPTDTTPRTTQRWTTPAPVLGGAGRCSGTPWDPPCTRANTDAFQLWHPHANPHMFLQCDLNGNCYEKSCSGSDTYDPFSHTCVDGPVHVDCPDINSPNCIHKKKK